eukprot:3941723-Rhodomonas_salina.7
MTVACSNCSQAPRSPRNPLATSSSRPLGPCQWVARGPLGSLAESFRHGDHHDHDIRVPASLLNRKAHQPQRRPVTDDGTVGPLADCRRRPGAARLTTRSSTRNDFKLCSGGVTRQFHEEIMLAQISTKLS